MFEIDYPEIAEGIVPRHRFMSAYEQKIEPPDRKWQYLLFAAEPYETISFKVRLKFVFIFLISILNLEFQFQVPSREVDKSETKFWTLWNKETKEFFLQFAFKDTNKKGGGGGGGGGQAPNILPPPPPRPPQPQALPPMPAGPPMGMVPPPPPQFNPVPPPPPM